MCNLPKQTIQQPHPLRSVTGQVVGCVTVGGVWTSLSNSLFSFFTQLLPSLFMWIPDCNTMKVYKERLSDRVRRYPHFHNFIASKLQRHWGLLPCLQLWSFGAGIHTCSDDSLYEPVSLKQIEAFIEPELYSMLQLLCPPPVYVKDRRCVGKWQGMFVCVCVLKRQC